VIRQILQGKQQWFVFGFIILLCALPKSVNAQCAGVPTSTTGTIIWTANWCDEFNGALKSQIDPAKWGYDTGASGFGNNELETYCAPTDNTLPCNSSTPNAFIDGSGHLAIQVRGPGGSDCSTVGTCTSARLKTAGLQSFNSGRIEASIQIPSHPGLWPAFWNLGSQAGVSWPTVGESDIMENWPTTSNIPGPGATGNCSTIHTQVTAGSGKGQCFTLPNNGQVTSFHAYGEIWSANMIQYYIDDPTKPFFVVTASDLPAGDTWPFSSSANPFFLIMNMAIGGTLGAPTDSGTSNPSPMLVDYVRQYLPSAISPPQMTPNGNITIKAGATAGNTTTIDMLGAMGTGRVTFSCSTNAPKASCVVTSSDAVNNHTVDFTSSTAASPTVTVTTTANAQAAAASSSTWIGMTAAGMLAFVLIPFHKTARRVRFGILLAGAILAIGLMPACGGGSSSGGPPPPPSGGTTPGSYTVTVNAYTVSSTDAANPSATTTFNLTVN
jgi:beta-glucanase (GH16 family)